MGLAVFLHHCLFQLRLGQEAGGLPSKVCHVFFEGDPCTGAVVVDLFLPLRKFIGSVHRLLKILLDLLLGGGEAPGLCLL